MHAEAYAYIERSREGIKSKPRVLEIGSYNVNGSVRSLFSDATEYVGIDERRGPDVDVVSTAGIYTCDDLFDVVVSCETLEHASDPAEVIACAWRCLKPGGKLLLTAAGPERAPHGPNGDAVGNYPYTAIDRRLLGKLLADWEDVTTEYGQSHGLAKGDIYATATKPKGAKAKEPTESAGE